MASKDAYLGQRIETYENTDVYASDGQPVQGLRVQQGRVDVAPTEDYHILRLADAITTAKAPRVVQVADISNPTEFIDEDDGDFPGQIGIAYATDTFTQYIWLPVTGGDNDPPYLLVTTNGLWIAIAGQYISPQTNYSGVQVFLSNIAVAGQANIGSLLGSTGATLPTILAGAAAGSAPTVAIVGRDMVGGISVIPGSTPLGSAGTLATITLGESLPVGYSCYPILTSKNGAAHALDSAHFCVPISDGATGWHLNAGASALTQGTTYLWDYFCVSLKN